MSDYVVRKSPSRFRVIRRFFDGRGEPRVELEPDGGGARIFIAWDRFKSDYHDVPPTAAVFDAEATARRCYEAANDSTNAGKGDWDRLTESDREFFVSRVRFSVNGVPLA